MGNKLKAKIQFTSYLFFLCIFLNLFMNGAEVAAQTHLFVFGNQRVCWCLEAHRF